MVVQHSCAFHQENIHHFCHQGEICFWIWYTRQHLSESTHRNPLVITFKNYRSQSTLWVAVLYHTIVNVGPMSHLAAGQLACIRTIPKCPEAKHVVLIMLIAEPQVCKIGKTQNKSLNRPLRIFHRQNKYYQNFNHSLVNFTPHKSAHPDIWDVSQNILILLQCWTWTAFSHYCSSQS